MKLISCVKKEIREEIQGIIQREIQKLKEAIANGTITQDDPIILEEREVFIDKVAKDYHIDDVHFRAYVEKVFADELGVE